MTLRRNVSAFSNYEILPSVLQKVDKIQTRTEVFGREIAIPLFLGPTGLNRMFDDDAELAVAKAAQKHGLLYSLSTMGTTTIETLAENYSGPKVFQIYIFKDRGLTREFVQRCKDKGYDGLTLTVDTPVAGNRERDHKSGLSVPPKLNLKSFMSFAMHPRWSLGALFGSKLELSNVSHRTEGLSNTSMSLFEYVNGQFDPSISWDDLEWLAAEWGGPLAVKGVMTPKDACSAVECGASGIIVSNHGGRQLDGAPAPIDQIAAIRNAVGSGIDVICDGGIRRGSDIIKAIALGANAVSIGRAYIWGLSAAGEAGVDRALTILAEEFGRAMALSGLNDVKKIGPEHVRKRL